MKILVLTFFIFFLVKDLLSEKIENENLLFFRTAIFLGNFDQFKTQKNEFVEGLDIEGNLPSEAKTFLKSNLINKINNDKTFNQSENRRLIGSSVAGDFNFGVRIPKSDFAIHGGLGLTLGSDLKDVSDKNYFFTDGYTFGSVGFTYFHKSGFFISPTFRKLLLATSLSSDSRVKPLEYDRTTVDGSVGFGIVLGYSSKLDEKTSIGIIFNLSKDFLKQVNEIWVAPSLNDIRKQLTDTVPDKKLIDYSFDITPFKVKQNINYTNVFYGVGVVVQYF